ncbi:hypothetical protein ACWIGW_39680 [Nocardia brasiliensis]
MEIVQRPSPRSIIELSIIAAILAMIGVVVAPESFTGATAQPGSVTIVMVGFVAAVFAVVILVIAPRTPSRPVVTACAEVSAADGTTQATIHAYVAVSLVSGRFFAVGTVTANSVGVVVTAVRVQLLVNDEVRAAARCDGVCSGRVGDTKECRTDSYGKEVRPQVHADALCCVVAYTVDMGGSVESGSIRSEAYRI